MSGIHLIPLGQVVIKLSTMPHCRWGSWSKPKRVVSSSRNNLGEMTVLTVITQGKIMEKTKTERVTVVVPFGLKIKKMLLFFFVLEKKRFLCSTRWYISNLCILSFNNVADYVMTLTQTVTMTWPICTAHWLAILRMWCNITEITVHLRYYLIILLSMSFYVHNWLILGHIVLHTKLYKSNIWKKLLLLTLSFSRVLLALMLP